MYNLGASGLIAAYVIIALLLLSLTLYSRWSWRVKATAILITSAFYVVSYFSFPPLMGWPSASRLPERFRVLSVYVVEPNKHLGTEGDIYLWVTNMEDDPNLAKPRAYRIAYTNKLHEQLIKVTKKLRKGLPQLGEAKEKNKRVDVKVEDTTRLGQKSLDLKFYDLPDPLFPEK